MSRKEDLQPAAESITEYSVLHALEEDASATVLNSAAWFYVDRGSDSKTAGRLFLRAAILEPWALHHRLEMARFLSLTERHDRAVEWLQGALRLALSQRDLRKEELALVYLELAHAYRRTNRSERYLRYLHLSLQACPGYRPALRLLEPA